MVLEHPISHTKFQQKVFADPFQPSPKQKLIHTLPSVDYETTYGSLALRRLCVKSTNQSSHGPLAPRIQSPSRPPGCVEREDWQDK